MVYEANKLFDTYERKCLELGIKVPNRKNWVHTEISMNKKKDMPKYLRKVLAEEALRSKELLRMDL